MIISSFFCSTPSLAVALMFALTLALSLSLSLSLCPSSSLRLRLRFFLFLSCSICIFSFSLSGIFISLSFCLYLCLCLRDTLAQTHTNIFVICISLSLSVYLSLSLSLSPPPSLRLFLSPYRSLSLSFLPPLLLWFSVTWKVTWKICLQICHPSELVPLTLITPLNCLVPFSFYFNLLATLVFVDSMLWGRYLFQFCVGKKQQTSKQTRKQQKAENRKIIVWARVQKETASRMGFPPTTPKEITVGEDGGEYGMLFWNE